MSSLSGRERAGIGVFLGLLCWVVFSYVLLPEYRRFRNGHREITENLRNIRVARDRLRDLPDLRSEVRVLERRLTPGAVESNLSGGFPNVLRELERLVSEAHIPPEKIDRIGRTDPYSPPESEPAGPVGVGIVAQFRSITMENLVRLIWRFRSLPVPVGVRTLRVDPVAVESRTFYDVRMSLGLPVASAAPGPSR